MTIQKQIVDSFGEVVERVNTVLLSYLQGIDATIQGIHYEHGHPREIVNTLKEMSTTQDYQAKKFPLVGLFEDIIEGQTGINYNSTAQLTLIIANQTLPQYKSADRYTKNFKPILIPIYEELLRQLDRQKDFVFDVTKKGNKINRVYWGQQGLYGTDGNVFDDYLDCIEVQNLSIITREAICPAYDGQFITNI